MSIAALLERAKAAVATLPDSTAETTVAAPSSDDPWPAGAWVELAIAGVLPTFGRVAFVDDGWVHWTALDGCAHASRPDALRRCR